MPRFCCFPPTLLGVVSDSNLTICRPTCEWTYQRTYSAHVRTDQSLTDDQPPLVPLIPCCFPYLAWRLFFSSPNYQPACHWTYVPPYVPTYVPTPIYRQKYRFDFPIYNIDRIVRDIEKRRYRYTALVIGRMDGRTDRPTNRRTRPIPGS